MWFNVYLLFQVQIFTHRRLIMLIFILKYMRIRFEEKMFVFIVFFSRYFHLRLRRYCLRERKTFPTQNEDGHEERFPSHIICAEVEFKSDETGENSFATNIKIDSVGKATLWGPSSEILSDCFFMSLVTLKLCWNCMHRWWKLSAIKSSSMRRRVAN